MHDTIPFRTVLATICFSVCSHAAYGAASPGMADEARSTTTHTTGSIDDRWALGLDLPVARATLRRQLVDDGRLGWAAPSLPEMQASLGYGVTDDWLASVAFSFEQNTEQTRSDSNSWLNGTLQPTVSYLFASGWARPFFGLQGNAVVSTSELITGWGAGGGAHGGVRVEVTEHFSIEPRLALDYLFTQTNISLAGVANANFQHHQLGGQASLRMSAWL